MLLGTKKNLQEKLIEYLSQKPLCTATEIWRALYKDTEGDDYTIQAVYKELRGLQAEGIIGKTGRLYALRLPWVLELSDMTEGARRRGLGAMIQQAPGRSNTEKLVVKFRNLFDLNDAWSQVMRGLLEQSKSKTVLEWSPHLWFHLLQSQQEASLGHFVEISGGHLFLIVGGETPLDRSIARSFPSRVVECSIGHAPFLRHDDLYVNIIDDSIVTLRIDKSMTDRIDALCEKTGSVKGLSLGAVMGMLSQSTKVYLVFERDKKKASVYRKKFADFFGEKVAV